jgi:predicted RND superfamily exporter protein
MRMRGEVILHDMFPYNHPYLQIQAKFAQIFGSGASGVVIAVKAKNGDIFNEKTLGKLQKMTNEVALWNEVYRVLTVSIASPSVKVVKARAGGEITIEPLMYPNLPKDREEIELLKRHIFSNPAYNGTLVSKDGTACLLITEFKENISYQKAFDLLKTLVTTYSDDNTSVHIVGFPMLMGWIYSLKSQIILLFVISTGLMVLVLYLIFFNFTGMLTPLAFGIIVTTLGLGFVGWAGINFSPLLYVLAFLVGARIISHSVQITHRYFEEYGQSGDRIQACYESMRKMIIPNVAAVGTETAGFLTLIFAKIALMQQVAVIMSFWMACIALAGILTPILCSYMPAVQSAAQGQPERRDLLARACVSTARACIGRGRYVLVGTCVLVAVFGLWQATKLKMGDPTAGTPLLWPNHTYNRDQALLNKTFDASSENFALYYEGESESVYDPLVLTTFEAFSRHMKENLPDIYKSSSSVIDMVRMVNETLHDGDKLWHQLPRDPVLLTSFMGYVRQNTDRGTLNRFVDGPMERAQITLFFADHSSDNLARIHDEAYTFFKTHPTRLEKGNFILAGGRLGMEMAVNAEMKRSHLVIDSIVFLTIFFLCAVSYFSFTAGLMLTIPLILSNLVAFAFMALSDIGLSINTLPVAAVSVGVGVDFAIFLYSRCRDEFGRQKGWTETITAAVGTCGKAIVYTGLTTILPILTWYFISDIKFQAQMGIFLSIIMGMNVVLALTLHPLLIHLVKPAFISGRGQSGEEQLSHTENGRRALPFT